MTISHIFSLLAFAYRKYEKLFLYNSIITLIFLRIKTSLAYFLFCIIKILHQLEGILQQSFQL